MHDHPAADNCSPTVDAASAVLRRWAVPLSPAGQMLSECGLCLALDDDKLERKTGGILTPASAMGTTLLERLRKAGMTFRVEDE